ncbi:MAG: exo-beta-N-acetylmuramidase NamZ family protein [Aeromonas sp.]
MRRARAVTLASAWLAALSCAPALAQTLNAPLAAAPIQLGVDRSDVYGPLLKGKRVGLMVNQSSRDSHGVHTIDKLLSEQQRYGFTVTKLFSVEHGLRGKAEAGYGDKANYRDPKSGLPVVSLYGNDANGQSRAQPRPEQLDDVDVIVFDLQDVGVRFFTYTISMHRMLESAQAAGKAFMVFDRPNPNGGQVYGPLLTEGFVSGIGIHPLPMVHDLTTAEFAAMINGELWLNGLQHADNQWQQFGQVQYQLPAADLQLIPMQGYQRGQRYVLPVPPSPNLANELAVRLYPSLGLFEATSVNMGRGSDYPHQQVGFPDPKMQVNVRYSVDAKQTDYGWPQGGKTVYGQSYRPELGGAAPATLQASITPFVTWWFKLTQAGYQGALDAAREPDYLQYAQTHYVIRPQWLGKVVGDDSLLQALTQVDVTQATVAHTVAAIEQSWQPALQKYLQQRQPYLLYPPAK